jgi:hypothetical protein
MIIKKYKIKKLKKSNFFFVIFFSLIVLLLSFDLLLSSMSSPATTTRKVIIIKKKKTVVRTEPVEPLYTFEPVNVIDRDYAQLRITWGTPEQCLKRFNDFISDYIFNSRRSGEAIAYYQKLVSVLTNALVKYSNPMPNVYNHDYLDNFEFFGLIELNNYVVKHADFGHKRMELVMYPSPKKYVMNRVK